MLPDVLVPHWKASAATVLAQGVEEAAGAGRGQRELGPQRLYSSILRTQKQGLLPCSQPKSAKMLVTVACPLLHARPWPSRDPVRATSTRTSSSRLFFPIRTSDSELSVSGNNLELDGREGRFEIRILVPGDCAVTVDADIRSQL